MSADGMTGARIAGARRSAGLTQQMLAAELGVSVRTIQNYESGRIVPYRHLQELSAIMHRSAQWLLEGGEPVELPLLERSRRLRVELSWNMRRLVKLRNDLDSRMTRLRTFNGE